MDVDVYTRSDECADKDKIILVFVFVFRPSLPSWQFQRGDEHPVLLDHRVTSSPVGLAWFCHFGASVGYPFILAACHLGREHKTCINPSNVEAHYM